MSDSNRGDESTVGLKRWLIPSAAFAAVLLGYGVIQNLVYYYDASTRAAAYASDTNNHIATECRVIDASPSCQREIENSTRENQRNEYDLYSQKAMAMWTGVMAAMAIIGIALSGVGVYLIWRTWDATREAADNSRKTLGAYVAKERAHLRVEGASQRNGANALHPSVGFTVSVANVGQSIGTINRYAYQYMEDYGWDPKKLIEISVSDLVTPAKSSISPFFPFKTESTAFTLLGYFDYTSLEDISGRTYFCFLVTRLKENGYAGKHWRAELIRPLAMPRDT